MPYADVSRQRKAGRESWHQRKLDKPWLVMLSTARRRSTDRGEVCQLTHDWFRQRWTGKCELTGVEFGEGPMAASVDRLDSSKGYLPENCRIILFCVNAFRGSMNDDKMREIAKRILA